MQCLNHQKQIGAALHNYASAYGRFSGRDRGAGRPLSRLALAHSAVRGTDRSPRSGGKSEGVLRTSTARRAAIQTQLSHFRIPLFICPSATEEEHPGTGKAGDETRYLSHYVGIMGPIGTNRRPARRTATDTASGGSICTGATQGVLTRDAEVRIRDISDGTSHTPVRRGNLLDRCQLARAGLGLRRGRPGTANLAPPLGCIVEARRISAMLLTSSPSAGERVRRE